MQIAVDTVLEGKVTSITGFGAFVALPEGKTGMVHISEVSTSYVKDIHDYLKEGQPVKVRVIAIDPNGRISLSVKRVGGEPKAPEPHKGPPDFSSDSRRKGNSDSFEDMMSRFKAASDEKISDLNRVTDSKRSSPGFSRKNNKY